MHSENNEKEAGTTQNFIHSKIQNDLNAGKNDSRVCTRFPPEPNGYLHLGHAKSICLNFGIAKLFNGTCNLRFDDTNPEKEDVEYVDSIKQDVQWLGGNWGKQEFYASNYFEKLYALAEKLISMGKAYVDSLNAEQIREHRGTLTEHGKNSPFRDRTIDENLELFRQMKAGKFADGEHVLRAKIGMDSPNIVMRDPIIYRIRHIKHHRTGDSWCIYPMYDFTHCLSDSLEMITHSICTLEFENNRELYNWMLDTLEVYHPQQIEFARLNLTYTVLSKRKLIQLVQGHYVNGWDDPRMPTLCGLRRRGIPAAAIIEFCERIGVARADSMVDYNILEFCIREKLNSSAKRYMSVLKPIKVIIDNYPEGQVEQLDMPFHPEDPSYGSRIVPFSNELYIEQDDFRLEAPKKYHRLRPGAEVRLRYAYYITCVDVVKDEDDNIKEIHCVYDPETKGGSSPDGRKIKGTLHWVCAKNAVPVEVRLYDHLFDAKNPNAVEDGKTFIDNLNPNSLEIVTAMAEPAIKILEVGECVQFERVGYFAKDPDSNENNSVFNRTATLKDTWLKLEKREQKGNI